MKKDELENLAGLITLVSGFVAGAGPDCMDAYLPIDHVARLAPIDDLTGGDDPFIAGVYCVAALMGNALMHTYNGSEYELLEHWANHHSCDPEWAKQTHDTLAMLRLFEGA